MPNVRAQRVNNLYIIPYILHDTQCSIYTSNHAIARSGKSGSLESVNDAKTEKQHFRRNPHNSCIWNATRNLIRLHFGLLECLNN